MSDALNLGGHALLTMLSAPLTLQPLCPVTTVPGWAGSARGAGGAGRHA